MPAIKSASEIADKWARVTPGRSTDYASGIEKPKKDWATETVNAEDAYEGGVSQAMAEKRFGKGVRDAGTEKWQRKARELGTTRWGPGISAAKGDYQTGFAPFRDVIERTTLPPRRPKGDPGNIDRVRVIASALHEAKVK